MNKTNVMRKLDNQKIDYKVWGHKVEVFTDAASLAKENGQPLEQTYKSIVCTGKSGKHYSFAVQATAKINLKKAASLVNEKNLELLPLEELYPLTGYHRGGCSIIGIKQQFPVIIDRSALNFQTILISAGEVGVMIEADTHALGQLVQAKFENIQV